MNKKPTGTAVRPELNRNCLLCRRYTRCGDPDKSPDYACSRFSSSLDVDFSQYYEQTREEEIKPLTRYQKGFNVDLVAGSNGRGERSDESIADIIESVLQSGVPVPPDLRVDDRDIPRPANVLEWMTNDRFIGTGDETPFARQVEVGLNFLGEWCPRCTDEDYWECVPVDATVDDILEHVQPLEFGRCPRCKATKAQLVRKGLLNEYYEATVLVGQRAGKTITTTMLESYNLARWLTTPNIAATFGVKSSTILTSTYTAVTYDQVNKNFWQPLNAILTGDNWFRQYHAFLNDVGSRYGEELLKHGEAGIAWRHRNIQAYPASPSQRTLRGKTRIGWVIDEGGWFKVGSKKDGKEFEQMNGTEVWKSLDSSMTTMRSAHMDQLASGYYNMPKPLGSMISSPQARNDLIMTKYREAENSKQTYRVKYKTWEFNPNLKKRHLAERYRSDPIGAARDYECEPPLAMNAWIADADVVAGCFSHGGNAIRVLPKRVRTRSGKLNMSGDFRTVRQVLEYNGGTIMGIDAGSVFNSFAFTIAYPTSIPDPEDEEAEGSVLTGMRVVAVGEIIPREDARVSFTGVYRSLIQPLAEQFNVAAIISDRWQNVKIVQDLEDSLGVPYFEYKMTMADFDGLRDAVFEQEVEFPKLDMKQEDILDVLLESYPRCFEKTPVAHLYYQMLTVQSAGSAVVKGDGVTDDVFRSMAICHAGLQDSEILEEVLAWGATPLRRPALGAVIGGSNGGQRTTAGASRGGSAVMISRGGGAGMARGGGGGRAVGAMVGRSR